MVEVERLKGRENPHNHFAVVGILYVCHPDGNRPRYGHRSTRFTRVERTVPVRMTKSGLS